VGRLSFFSGKGIIAMAASILCAAGLARAVEPLEKDSYCRALRRRWKDIELSRDLEYWRHPERTPGPFLCKRPAATDVWVSCDRWPDGSDSRRFGLDAVRLSGARTEHEKALAVYRWVRRWMIFNNDKGAPAERLVMPRRPRVHQAVKLLNVYGVHWCGGQARTVELVWRALGYRAEKVCRGGHTIVGMYYRDFDGVERWHGLDVSHAAVAWDRSYRRLLGIDELSSRFYAFYYQYGLPGNGHIYFDDHRMELAFRPGEKLERIWGNWGKPYQDNAARDGMSKRVPEYERGPYLPVTFGNGRWTYSPDLSRRDWTRGLAEPTRGMAPGKLQPAAPEAPATAVWHFRTPYIVSDATVRMKLARKTAADVIRLHLSVDNGKTWKPIWDCPADAVGTKELAVPICPKFEVTEKGKVPKDFHSPFGRYAYRLKLELVAKQNPEDCRVESIAFETTVQQNMLSLPQLQPGRNRITVRGKLAKGAALKVTYVWDDPKGKGRRNVTVVESAPYTYEIIAAGRKWKDCVCKSIIIEAVRATGEGNRTVVREQPSPIHKLPPMRPVAETTGTWGQPRQGRCPGLEQVADRLKRRRSLASALPAACMLADPGLFDLIKPILYETTSSRLRRHAIVALYNCDPKRARPVLLDVLNDQEGKRVRWSKGKDKKDEGWGRAQSWCVAGTIIGYCAAEAGWKEFLPGLLKVLAHEQCSPYWGPRYGTVRVIGRLGKGDRAAADMIEKVLTHKLRKEHGDTLVPAALAAGRIGDPALIPALRKHLDSSYWPLKHNAALALSMLGDRSIAPRMRDWLTVKWDENFRGYAAEALGNLKDADSLDALEAALTVEPFPWVREKMERAIKAARRGAAARRPG